MQFQSLAPLPMQEWKVKTFLGNDSMKCSFWEVLKREGNNLNRPFILFEFSLLYPALGAAQTRILQSNL